ncbi:MAG: cadherin-like beta sandwich domain-containing protein, partial [Chloroflexi bacterium]|nr:cadherin-like beta sandwich domain-containing protein [Chloroflexota bacterium]
MRKMYIDSKFILPALLFIGMVIALAQLGTPSVEAQQDYESVAVISLDPAAVPIGGGIARGGTTEGEPFAIGVVRSDAGFGDTVGDIDVYITVTPGEATPGQDYTDNTGDGIVSTSGENGKILAFPINVTIHDDTICEMTSNVVRETFYVTIDEDATRANNPDAGNFRFENTKVRVRIYDNGNERPNEVFSVWASLKDGTLTAGWGGDGLCGDDLEAQYRLGTSGDWSEFPEPPIIDEDGSRIITGLTGYIAQVRVRSTHTLNGNSDWKTATNDEAFWLTGLRVYSGTRALTLFSTTDSHGNWFYPNWFRYVVKVAPGTRSLDITPAWNGGTDGSVEWDTRDTNSGSSQLASGSIAASGTKTSISLVGGDRPTLIRVHFTIADNTNTYEIYVLYDVGESANNYLNSLQGSMGSGGSSSGQSISMSGSAASSAASGGAVGQISRAGLQLDTLSNTLTLTPAFDEKIFKYTTTVPHDVTQITLDPKPSHPIATVTVNGNSPLTPVNLSAGRNVVKIVVTAENGDKRTYTVVVERPNRAPFVTSPLPDISMRVDRPIGFGVIVQGTFSDPDGDRLDVTSTSSDENVVTASMRNQALLSLSPVSAGTAVITVTAKDDRGGTAQDSFTVVVSSDDQNQQKAAPVVASAIADISGLEAEDSRTISMSAVFSDPDGDTVTVTQASSSDISIAAVSAAIDGSTSAITAITVTGVSEGTATITVTARDADGNTVSDAFDVTVNAPAAQQQVNNAPTVSAAIADATIVNETGTHRVALSGVFSDADGDDLTITTSSSAESVATIAVSADYSTLTVSAKSRGTATVTVTASDGYG